MCGALLNLELILIDICTDQIHIKLGLESMLQIYVSLEVIPSGVLGDVL